MKAMTPTTSTQTESSRSMQRLDMRRASVAKRLRERKCGMCEGAFVSDVAPDTETDACPEYGIEECSRCGAIWNMDENSWMDDLRGGNAVGMLIREPHIGWSEPQRENEHGKH